MIMTQVKATRRQKIELIAWKATTKPPFPLQGQDFTLEVYQLSVGCTQRGRWPLQSHMAFNGLSRARAHAA